MIVQSFPTSVDDWQRAQIAPSSELPALTEEQKEVARKFGLSEERYARSYLSSLYGQQRTHDRGAKLGEFIRELIREGQADSELLAMIWDMDRVQWVARVRSGSRIATISIPRELADDFLDSGRAIYKEQIKDLVRSGVARKRVAKK